MNSENNKGKNKILIIAAALAVVTIIAATAIFIWRRPSVKENGIEYFYSTLSNSVAYYTEQLDTLKNENPVLNHIRAAAKSSFSHEITLDSAGIVLNNDAENKILNGLITIDGLPVSVEFFITDEKLILGSPSLFYAEAAFDSLGQDITNFTLNNGLLHYGEIIERVLRPFDLSYSGLTRLDFFNLYEEAEALSTRYKETFKKLSDKCIYEQSDGVITIGDNEEKCEVIKLTADKEAVLSWINEDFLPFVSSDEDIKLLMNGLNFITNGYVKDYSRVLLDINSLAKKIEAEEDSHSISVEFYVYDGIIVSVSTKLADISATGAENRLDRVITDKLSVVSDTVSGELKIIEDGAENGKISYSWEASEITSNILIVPTRNNLIMTYPNDNKAIELTMPDDRYLPITAWTVTELENPVALPEDTLVFKDMTIMSIIGMLGEYMSYLY